MPLAGLRMLAGVSAPAAQAVAGELIEAVDAWFAKNTGLGGCSDKDVAELAAIFAAPHAQADARAAELLGFLQDQCIDLRCFTTSDGEDVGWRTVQHHMDKPHERVVSEVCSDDPRRAIREAMARIERDPYCTGPLHLEDDAAIAAAKGE